MALALAAYRFGSEDGTEATHGWLANLNTALDRQADNAGTFFVRALVQATGAGQLNCDFQLRYNRNGAGFVNVTTTSSVVKAVATAIFADAANTTARLGGSGTFESSSQGCSHDGVCGGTAFDILTDGNGECLYSVQLVPADIAAGDTITFDLVVDGATFTQSVTPTINVTTPPPAITSIDADNDTVDTRTGVAIVGTSFGAAGTGSFKVEVSNNATYGTGTVVQITATYNSATSITATLRRSSDSVALATLFTLPLSPAYLWITSSTGLRNAVGFQFTLRAAGATAMAAANTTPVIPLNTTKYLRVRVTNTGGTGATAYRWAYSLSGGAWTAITTVSSVIRAVAAADFANDEDVPNVLGNATGYVTDNNAATEDGTISLTAALPANGVFESVLAFQRLDSGPIQIRLELNDGTAFTTYTNTPTIASLAVAASLLFPPLRSSVRVLLVQ